MDTKNVVVMKRRDGSAEFDCVECGKPVIRLCGGGPPKCALCINFPGARQSEDGRIIPPSQ